MIRIMRNGQVYEGTSITGFAREQGSGIVNRKQALKYLDKIGFDLSTLEEDKKTHSTGGRSSIIEKLIKQCQTVDKDLIKKLTDELNLKVSTLSTKATAEDVQQIVELNQKIEEARNPEVTLENVQSLVKTMYEEYMAKQDEETEPETEPKETKTETKKQKTTDN